MDLHLLELRKQSNIRVNKRKQRYKLCEIETLRHQLLIERAGDPC